VGKARRCDRWPELCRLVEEDDRLSVNEYGQWTEQKLHFWNRYVEITTSAMVGHPSWPSGLAYVDLFAGSGVCRIEGSARRIPGSPLIAACSLKAFTKILLCEMDPGRASACEARIRRVAPNAATTFFEGDCNEKVREIARHIPTGALTLAFIDPQGLDIAFETVSTLACCGRVDLLILLADAVDFVRNVDTYLANPASKLDRFLGPDSDWRAKWHAMGSTEGPKARKFVGDVYRDQLGRLGYIKFGTKSIRGPAGPLYRLIYASKHPKGLEFWEKVTRKDVGGQSDLF